MKKIIMICIFLLAGCGKNEAPKPPTNPAMVPAPALEVAPAPAPAPAPQTENSQSLSISSNTFDFDYEDATEYEKVIGAPWDSSGGNALVKKQLATGVGKTIRIKSITIWSVDSIEWEKGGKLHLINDWSLGKQHRVICSVSPSIGDKFMETKERRYGIPITGKIVSYSSSDGLRIDPCVATF
jgi:hypothetical protein